MPFYIAEIREVHVSVRRFWAEDIEHARADAGGGEELALTYSHTIDEPYKVELDTDQTDPWGGRRPGQFSETFTVTRAGGPGVCLVTVESGCDHSE
jgi:hypothetical protein